MRAKSFLHLCQHKTIYIGDGELIVGERGPAPKAVPTFPELTCHSVEDLEILNSRPKTWYRVDDECIRLYREKVIPYWRGRSMRDRMFAELPPEWHDAYAAGIFTEFMEQRAPGHTVLDDKIYRKGMLDFKKDIAEAMAKLDFLNDPQALDKREALKSFDISCDALILFAERHAALARELAAKETDPQRKAELLKIAEVCSHVPAHAPRDFQEALQYYWFCHLAVITELNGWDSFNPGHLDQHLLPFYERGLADGTLTKESARELLECFFIKFNNHPAPPKVGVTAAESGTYTDFANINIGGLLRDGSDGSNEVSRPAARHRGRDAPAPAEHQHPAFAQKPRPFPQARAARRQQGLRFSQHLQRRRRGAGTASPGQEPGGRARRRLQRLRGGGRVRQGSLHPHRLFQHAESASNSRCTTAWIR